MANDDFSLEMSPEALIGPILPLQCFALTRRRSLFDGECRLLLAVLEHAIRSYLSTVNGASWEQRAQFAEVRRWFYASRGVRGLFTFDSICAQLDIDTEVFRKRLRSINLRDLRSDRRPMHRSLGTAQRRAQCQRPA